MEDVKCLFCRQSGGKIVIEENGFKGRKCSQCSLIYMSPRPTFTETLNLYVSDQGLTSASMHLSDAFVKRLHAKDNISIIQKYRKDGAILEIGSGAGYFLDEARKKGFESFGIEPNKIAADFINNKLKIPCEETGINESTFGDKKFNVIYHCNVLSHLYDPIDEFQKIHEKLSHDGILVFETGNIGEMNQKYFSLIDTFGYPDHLYFFGENSIRLLLENTKFEIIKIYKYSIQLYLMVHKFKQKIIDIFLSEGRQNESSSNNKSEIFSPIRNSFEMKYLLKSVYRTALYFIRYKFGYVLPKDGRPQTTVVIARKKKRCG